MLSASLIPAVVCTNICECRRGQMLATSTYRSYGANVEKRAQFIADQLSFGLSNVTSSFRTLNICRRRFISIATPPMNKKKNMKKPSRPIKMKYRWWNELNTRHDTEEKKNISNNFELTTLGQECTASAYVQPYTRMNIYIRVYHWYWVGERERFKNTLRKL